MAIFCTDAGHGGTDSGAAWQNVLEKELNLRYVLAFNDELKKRGHQVWTTRKTDQHVPNLTTRCQLINAHHSQGTPKFDAIISLHCDVAAYRSASSGRYMANEAVRGFYAIYSRESIQGRDLAKSIANEAKENGIAVKDGGKMTILIQS
ncbi:MAG: N-acetylmuramoyl-L-alanine amidase [Calditrichae bacterium]|nr:N-acetylmuramoyl-L-alanine amidase [Calditrichia bacterium]